MYLGIDIGGTKTLVAALDNQGVLVEQYRFPTPKDYASFIREVAHTVANMSTKIFTSGCVAFPGKVDREHGIGIALGNLPWRNVGIQNDIERIVKCPIVVENDANLAGLSEAMLLKNEFDRVLYVTISTGIGTGIIINQRIDPNFEDSEGGEVILEYRGKLQMWQRVASGSAIVKRFGARAQDITDQKTWKIISHAIALGMLDLIPIIQPEVIVLGGGVSTYFERFAPYIEQELQRYATPLSPVPVIRKANRPNEAVVYGCYDQARLMHGKTSQKITTR